MGAVFGSLRRRVVWWLAAVTWTPPIPTPAPRPVADLSVDERESAVAAIHRRAQNASPGTAEARWLSAQLSEIGRVFLAQGESGRAIELLNEAYALDEANGLVLAELTLAYVRAEDYDAAAFYLRLAESRASRAPPEIYAVLGEIYDGLHRLEDAALAWGESVRLGGQDPALLRRLARIRDELAVAQGQRSLDSETFAIFAEPAIPDVVLRRTAETLEAAHRAQSALFGARLPRRQVVVLYAGRTYFSLVSVPDWGSGAYDGKIRVVIQPDAEEDALPAVLAHELAHAMMRQLSHDRVPGWLHEGLAQWLEGRRIPLRDVRKEIGAGPARSIEALEGAFPTSLDRSQVRALYAQTLSIVEYLVALRGEGAIGCVVSRLGDGASLTEALESEVGLSPVQLYRAWSVWAGVSREGGGTPQRGSGVGAGAEGASPRKATHAGSVAIERKAGSARTAERSSRPCPSSGRSAATVAAASPERAWICASSSAFFQLSPTRARADSIVRTAAAASPRLVSTTASVASVSGSGPVA